MVEQPCLILLFNSEQQAPSSSMDDIDAQAHEGDVVQPNHNDALHKVAPYRTVTKDDVLSSTLLLHSW